MDDFYIIHEDKAHLKQCLAEITEYLGKLGLTLNDKTGITPLRNGIDFLGFRLYLTDSGKVVRKLRHKSVKRMKARIKKWAKDQAQNKENFDLEAVWQSYQAWNAHAAHGDTRQVRITIKRMMSANFKDIRENKTKPKRPEK